MKLTDAEWTVSGVIAVEFAKTGVVDCPRLAKLICKSLRLRHGFKPASVPHTKNHNTQTT